MSKLLLSSRPAVAPVERQLVFEDNFAVGYDTRLPWAFFFFGSGVTFNHVTMNGHPAVEVTYPAGSSVNVRWGGQLRFPNWPTGYEEGWFTYDVKFHNIYSVPALQKQPGVFGSHEGFGFPGSPPPNCSQGWLCRWQLGDGLATPHDRDPKSGQMYYYWNQATREVIHWDPNNPTGGGIAATPVPLDVVLRIELYWKVNSAFDEFDGIIRYKMDPGMADAHAEPTTVLAEKTDFQMYCGSEANRVNGHANEIGWTTFFGGPVSPDWEPLVDSTATYGRIAVEIPA